MQTSSALEFPNLVCLHAGIMTEFYRFSVAWKTLSPLCAWNQTDLCPTEERLLLDRSWSQNSKESFQRSFLQTMWTSHRQKQWLIITSTTKVLDHRTTEKMQHFLQLRVFTLTLLLLERLFSARPGCGWVCPERWRGLRSGDARSGPSASSPAWAGAGGRGSRAAGAAGSLARWHWLPDNGRQTAAVQTKCFD